MSGNLWVAEEAEAAEEFMQSQHGYRELVLWICERFPSAIGDYRKLDWYVMVYINHIKVKCEHCGKETKTWLSQEQLESMCRPESINRAYRKLKEMGMINEDEKTVAHKELKERFFRESHGGTEDIQVQF